MDFRTGRETEVLLGPKAADHGKPSGTAQAHPAEPFQSSSVISFVRPFDVTPDGRRLLLNEGGNSVWVLDTEGPGRAIELIGHAGEVNAAALFPDGLRAVTGSDDRTVKLWDTTTGRELLSLPQSRAVTAVAVAPDGQSVFTVAGGTARIWSAITMVAWRPLLRDH